MSTAGGSGLLQSFSRGFFYPFSSGPFLLAHPGLLRFIAIPFLINTAIFSIAVYFGLDFFNRTVTGYLPQGEAWYWLLISYALWVVAVLLTAVLVFFGFSVVGNLLAAPFNDLLSERTQEILGDRRSDEPLSLNAFWADTLRTLRDEAIKMACFVLGMLFLLLLNLIPVLGTLLYAVLSVTFTLFFLAVEYTGFVFGRQRRSFGQQCRYLFSRKSLLAGFSSGVLALLAIPFLQFVCIPLAVVGATRLCHDFPAGEEQAGPTG